jgi:hypothetical protein
MKSPNEVLADVIDEYHGVLSTAIALRHLTQKQLRCRVSSGRWQQPIRGVAIAQSGPLTDGQLLRVAQLRAGPRSALAGLTAARLDGFNGFDDKAPVADRPIYLLIPYGYKRVTAPLGLTVITHYSRFLGDEDVHPTRQPRRTRIARSLIDAAARNSTSSTSSSVHSDSRARAGNPPAGTAEAVAAGSTRRGTTTRSRLRSTAPTTPKIRSSAGTTWSGTSTSRSMATHAAVPRLAGQEEPRARRPPHTRSAQPKRATRPEDRDLTPLPGVPAYGNLAAGTGR